MKHYLVRVEDRDGTQMGIMPIWDAKVFAEQQHSFLYLLEGELNPPLYKVL